MDLEMKIRADLAASVAVYQDAGRLAAQLHALEPKLAGHAAALGAARELAAAATQAAGGGSDLFGSGAAGGGMALINGTLGALTTSLDSADAAPTSQDAAVYQQEHSLLEQQLAAWKSTRAGDLAKLNPLLDAAGLPEVH